MSENDNTCRDSAKTLKTLGRDDAGGSLNRVGEGAKNATVAGIQEFPPFSSVGSLFRPQAVILDPPGASGSLPRRLQMSPRTPPGRPKALPGGPR